MSHKILCHVRSQWYMHAVSVVFLVSVLIAGCNSLEFKSHWRTRAIEMDGKNTEWQNTMTRIEGKQVMIGFLNDDNYLYVSFVTDDRAIQRQVMFRGLTVWFDRQGGEEQKFGIRFPLGFQMAGFGSFERDRNRESNPEDTLRLRIPMDTTGIEIIGPTEGEHHTLNITELKQIVVKANVSNGSLVYELKVPLMDNGPDPYAIGTKAGGTIGVGLETGARMERQGLGESGGNEMPGGMGRGGRGGGYGGRGGGRRGGGDGSRGSGGQTQAEPLKVWAKVQLAIPDSSSQK